MNAFINIEGDRLNVAHISRYFPNSSGEAVLILVGQTSPVSTHTAVAAVDAMIETAEQRAALDEGYWRHEGHVRWGGK